MHRVILWSQGQTVYRCSRKTWRDGQSKLCCKIATLTLGWIRVRIGTLWNESGTLFCGAASNSAVQHGTPPWELQTPHRGNYRPYRGN
ncbi:MAG: hypothetical protein ACSHXL_00070 [Bacteroidota bacterium]